MKYVSTRNNQIELSFKDVFIKGLSEDGGLFVPKTLEAYKEKDLNDLSTDKVYSKIQNVLQKIAS